MKNIVTIILSIIIWGCKQHPKDNTVDKKIISKEIKSDNSSIVENFNNNSDTINRDQVIKEWSFNKEKIALILSDKSDDFYNYGYLKIGSQKSKEFIRIPKEDSPYSGFEKIVIKYPYFTIEQTYREGDYTNYEYITFKNSDQSIYLYKYAIDYTNNQNLEDDIPELRLDKKAIGLVRLEKVNSEFLASLRSKE